jgi:predicted ribosomally synthesized peptide with SipW-like signal peptide
MSARKSLPIGIIIMIFMMALSALGIGYAWWTEQLTATGSIQTGNIDIKMENLRVTEGDSLQVGDCLYELSGDQKVITVTINNAYPKYTCSIDFTLNNYGTVPAKITNINLPILKGEFIIVPKLKETMLLTSQPVTGNFFIEIRQKAAEDTKYQFDLSFDVVQANAP